MERLDSALWKPRMNCTLEVSITRIASCIEHQKLTLIHSTHGVSSPSFFLPDHGQELITPCHLVFVLVRSEGLFTVWMCRKEAD